MAFRFRSYRLRIRDALLGHASVRRCPTVLQMEAVECGAASLAMILAYHGAWIPLERLRIACGVSRDGSKASNVVKAAREFGFAAKGFRKEPSTLQDLPMPCIIHWNFNHFVVLEGIDGDRVYINDPAMGRRQLDKAELDLAFTGVVLAMEPTEAFRKVGSKPRGLRLLVNELRNSRAPVALLVAVSLALIVPGVVIPGFIKVLIDEVLIKNNTSWLVPLLLGMALTALFRAAATAFQQSLLLRLQTKLALVMIARFLAYVLSLPMEFFMHRHAGDLSNRVSMNDEIARLLSTGVATDLLNLASVVFFAIAMAFYDPVLAAVGVTLSMVNVVALRVISRRREDLSRSLALEQGKLAASTVSIVRGIESLKASGIEDDAFAQWAGIQAKTLNAEQDLGASSIFVEMFPTLLSGLTVAAVLGLGGLRVIDGSLTLGGLVAFQSLMASFCGPITGLVERMGSLQVIRGGLERLHDIYNFPIATNTGEGSPAPATGTAKLVGRLELDSVEFGYSILEPPLLVGVSMTVEPGTRVALVGASGSGKSTLGRLICGLYSPWVGEIRIDGRPLREIPSDVMAASVSYVDQDVFLFDGTARDNLTLWDPTVADSWVSRALMDAAIHDDIAVRVGNYDCHVAEGGTNFSGGQRQRIEIARALVGDPSLVVLDEATAALDPITEKTIDDNLRRRGCTCIIIAHRLSTIRDCDEIIVLEQGKIVERGTHEHLLAKQGAYARLVTQQ